MRKSIFVFVLATMLLSTAIFAAEKVSIYDIQFTVNPGAEGTYPSPYEGIVVQTEGVVTAIGFNSNYLMLSDENGGPWNSVVVQARDQVNRKSLRVGDYIEVEGEVHENFGNTELRNINVLRRRAGSGSMPQAFEVTTGELAVTESLEGALVKIRSVNIVGMRQETKWSINDGTGSCVLYDGFNVMNNKKRSNRAGDTLEYVQGSIVYQYGEYQLCPRYISDLSSTGSHQVHGTSWGRVKSLYK